MNITRVALLTGTNQGNRYENLTEARLRLTQRLAQPALLSAVYHTQAWGGKSSSDYLNQVLIFDSSLSAADVLDICLDVEREMGRVRGEERWTDRIIDIDILVFGNEHLALPHLQIPHPRLPERKFALAPLKEVWPEWVHPVYNLSVADLWAKCEDELEVKIFEEVIG